MNGLLQFDALERTTLPAKPLHLAIGMFDGVHLGHRTVIAAAVYAARRDAGMAGVLTFWPHPSALLRPEQATKLIMAPPMKHRVLATLGVDCVIEQQFTREFAAIKAADFVPLLKRCLPSLVAVYVGENWRFGCDRLGDTAFLAAEGKKAGLKVFSAPRREFRGAPISSSRIRDLIGRGAMAEANALLGYLYFAEGTVAHGRKLGREIGFPTLNVPWEPEVKPAYGVYAVTVQTAGGPAIPGVANYGLRPTVEHTAKPLLEVHLLQDSAITYGDKVTVNWLHFLRPESKFGSIEALRRQIETDRQNALEFFAKVAPGKLSKDA